MSEKDAMSIDKIEETCSKDNERFSQQISQSSHGLSVRFDKESMIQAVVMAELLAKPKAKRRKRWHIEHESINH